VKTTLLEDVGLGIQVPNMPQLCARLTNRHRIRVSKMKGLALAAVALVALIEANPASAGYEGAYMNTGFDFYTRRCDLPNYEACRNEIMATAGTWCTQNPRYRGPTDQPSRTKRQKPRY
jgi:hypothetical protein